jgi:hypothetical protein
LSHRVLTAFDLTPPTLKMPSSMPRGNGIPYFVCDESGNRDNQLDRNGLEASGERIHNFPSQILPGNMQNCQTAQKKWRSFQHPRFV